MDASQTQTNVRSVPTRPMEFDSWVKEVPRHFAADGDIVIRHLLMWHALEEAEHKAVAFDVYRAVGGTERMRKAAMWVVHANFVFETGLWTLISLAKDPAAWRHPLRVLQGLWRLRRSPFTSRR